MLNPEAVSDIMHRLAVKEAKEAEGKEAAATVNLKIHLKQSLKARYNRIGG